MWGESGAPPFLPVSFSQGGYDPATFDDLKKIQTILGQKMFSGEMLTLRGYSIFAKNTICMME